MKKTFAITCTALAAMLVFGSAASAWYWQWKGFHGKYELVASGICNHSTKGWEDSLGTGEDGGSGPPFIPVKGSKIWAANATIQATVYFRRNGTGYLSGKNFISLLPGGDPVNGIANKQVDVGPVGGEFKWEITNDGEITITHPSHIMTGVVSPDWNVISVVNANTIQDLRKTAYESYAIQNLIRIFTRMGD